jgi:hypothetical protein
MLFGCTEHCQGESKHAGRPPSRRRMEGSVRMPPPLRDPCGILLVVDGHGGVAAMLPPLQQQCFPPPRPTFAQQQTADERGGWSDGASNGLGSRRSASQSRHRGGRGWSDSSRGSTATIAFGPWPERGLLSGM